jgi:uridine kinase
MNPYLIGVTGGSASGKTSFLNELMKSFNEDEICLISQDHYYVPIDQQKLDDKGVENFDIPESIDRKGFFEDVKRIKRGELVQRQEYTFNNPTIEPKILEFNPAPVVIIEGLFVLYFTEIKKLLDLKVFVDAQSHIALKRRIIRDKEERGYDLDDVLYRFEHHVMPAFDRYLRPNRKEADLIVPNDVHFGKALAVIEGFIRWKLR